MMDHSQAEDKDTISSILGMLFSERSDEEANTMVSESTNKEGIQWFLNVLQTRKE